VLIELLMHVDNVFLVWCLRFFELAVQKVVG